MSLIFDAIDFKNLRVKLDLRCEFSGCIEFDMKFLCLRREVVNLILIVLYENIFLWQFLTKCRNKYLRFRLNS